MKKKWLMKLLVTRAYHCGIILGQETLPGLAANNCRPGEGLRIQWSNASWAEIFMNEYLSYDREWILRALAAFTTMLILNPLFSQEVAATPSGMTPVSAAQDWSLLRQNLWENITPNIHMRLSHAHQSAETSSFLQKMNQLISQLAQGPHHPPLPKVHDADKRRWCAYLMIMKARLLKERYIADPNPPNADPAEVRSQLAKDALKEVDESLKLISAANDTTQPGTSPAERTWLQTENVVGHLHALAAHAFAILWDAGGGREPKKKAKEEWNAAKTHYEGVMPPPSPELAALLGLNLGNGGVMTEVSWIGVVLMLIGLILTLCIPKATVLGQWMLRSFFAVGASMASTVVPGLLNVNLNEYVVAGGSLAVIVILYLLNPPKPPGAPPRRRANNRPNPKPPQDPSEPHAP